MHHRLDHQCRFQYGRGTKQIIGAVSIVLGNPDPSIVLVPHLARLDYVTQQRFADGTYGHAPARMIRYQYRLPETLAEHCGRLSRTRDSYTARRLLLRPDSPLHRSYPLPANQSTTLNPLIRENPGVVGGERRAQNQGMRPDHHVQ